jgi:hypothetical protein
MFMMYMALWIDELELFTDAVERFVLIAVHLKCFIYRYN